MDAKTWRIATYIKEERISLMGMQKREQERKIQRDLRRAEKIEEIFKEFEDLYYRAEIMDRLKEESDQTLMDIMPPNRE